MTMNRRRFLQAAGAGASLGVTGASWAFHDDGLPLMQPSYGDIVGLEILGFNDMRLPGQPRAEGWDQTYEFRCRSAKGQVWLLRKRRNGVDHRRCHQSAEDARRLAPPTSAYPTIAMGATVHHRQH